MGDIDYIIVGQGLAGSFLSYYLLQAGKKVLVIDNNQPNTASKVASGIINPVTGRRIVRTWMIETLMPFAMDAYQAVGDLLGEPLFNKTQVLDFHPSPQMKIAFEERIKEGEEYLQELEDTNYWDRYFNILFGIGRIHPCVHIEVATFIGHWRNYLLKNNCLLEADFNWNNLKDEKDHVVYNSVVAKAIIFCDGVGGSDNPYFNLLPFALNKGEALIVAIPDLPKAAIYKQGITITPWKDGLFWVGSSYEWNFEDALPTEAFRNKTVAQLKQWLKLHFTVENHTAAIRPANIERRPFVGMHPKHAAIGIFNGLGTKGCSLAPYFAKQLMEHLLHHKPLDPLVDIQRFQRILGK